MKKQAIFLIIVFIFISGSSASADVITLSEGLKLATDNSRLVKISQTEEMVSGDDSMIAMARMLPNLNASMSKTSLKYQPTAIFGPNTVSVSERDFYTYSMSIQQTLFDFWGDYSRYKASKVLIEAKKLDTRRIKNLVAIDFVLIYLDLLESEKMLLVAEKEVERLESHLNKAKIMHEEGVITKDDLLQAEVKISDGRQRLLTARNIRALNASRLNNSLLRPLRSEVQTVDIDGIRSEAAGLDIETAWDIAEKERAEVLIVDETLKSLNLEKKAKISEFFPEFFLRGGYDYTENRFQLYEENWSIMFGININLFNGGSTRAEVSKIKHQSEKLVEQRNKLVDDIKLEVEQYILNSQSASERLKVTSGAIKQAEESLRINRLRYEEGVGIATDVMDAVTLLTVAESNYYRSLYDLRKSEAAVLYSIGKEISEVYK